MEKVYELCEHKWKTILKQQEYIGMSGTWMTEKHEHFKIVWTQQCEKCGKVNKIS